MDNREKIRKTSPKRNNPNEYQLDKPQQSVTPVWTATFKDTPAPIIELEEGTEKQDSNTNAYGVNGDSEVKASWDSSSGNRCTVCNGLLRMDSVLLNYVCDKCGSFYDPKTLEKIKNDRVIAVSDELKAKRNSESTEDTEVEENKTTYIQSPFKSINRSSADSVKCPGCSSNMIYNPDIKGLICKNCGGIYKASDLTIISESRAYDEGELTDINDKQNEITCNNCGAHIVADKNTSATTCAFCGSPALIVGRLSHKFEPDYIIPFKINKEEAVNGLSEWAESGKNIPKLFYSQKNIEKITGIYVPFWLTDADCSLVVDVDGFKVTGLNSGALYRITREYDLNLQLLPFDGSTKWKDYLMRAIEPFNYEEMELYRESQAYLNGFKAERFDLPYYQMTDTIYHRIESLAYYRASKIRFPDYDKSQVHNVSTFVDKMNFYYCLIPIWFINYDYGGEKYQFIVNGQTGKVAGEAPLNVSKLRRYYISRYMLFGLVAAVSVLLGIGITVAGIYGIEKSDFFYFREEKFDSFLLLLGLVILVGIYLACKVFIPWYRKIEDHPPRAEVYNLPAPVETYVRCAARESAANKDEFYLATDGNFTFSKGEFLPYFESDKRKK